MVLGLFASPLRINHRLVMVGDGIRVPKRGKKMPGAKLLYQVSDSNKPEYIMVHPLRGRCASSRTRPATSMVGSSVATVIGAPCSTR